MKETLLALISDDKKNAVEPLIDDVIAFYAGGIELHFTDEPLSRFARGLSNEFKPAAGIYLSRTGNFETSLVHELLHLRLPTRTRVLLYGEISPNQDWYFNILNNCAEHDLMSDDFQKMGYNLDSFLVNGFDTIDYEHTDQPAEWWKYEFYKILLTKDHVGAHKAKEGEEALLKIQQYGEQFHPGINGEFQKIKDWHESKIKSDIKQHPDYMIQLGRLLMGIAPSKYLAVSDEDNLVQVNIPKI